MLIAGLMISGIPLSLYDDTNRLAMGELGQVVFELCPISIFIKNDIKILKKYIEFNFSVSFQFFRMSPRRGQ